MATGLQRSPGGKGLNQAVIAARAGAEVHFMAALGPEPETALIRDTLAREPLAACHLVDVGAPTDLSSLMVAPDGENCIVSTGACCDTLGENAAIRFVSAMRADDILLMQGNLREPVTRAAMQAARARGARIMLNTAPIRWDYAAVAPFCDLVIANRHEARAITGHANPHEAAAALAPAPALAIVTLGAEGCLLAAPQPRLFPAQPARALDTTGAGDVFCGALAAAWARGAALPQAILRAQRAAAISVGREGCFGSFPTAQEMKQDVLF
jgi:ribokinase